MFLILMFSRKYASLHEHVSMYPSASEAVLDNTSLITTSLVYFLYFFCPADLLAEHKQKQINKLEQANQERYLLSSQTCHRSSLFLSLSTVIRHCPHDD